MVSPTPPDLAAREKPSAVVRGDDFIFAASHLEHGHIYGQCEGLVAAGAKLKWIFDPDPHKAAALHAKHPTAQLARALDEILDDPAVRLVAAAAVPCDRGPLGCRVMQAGKDYFTDKTPFTTLDQLVEARRVAAATGRKYAVYYSERVHNEAAMHATDLIARGAIGRVLQVIGLGPHRLGKASRPAWFFEKKKYGGILCDIGSHQFEQFLTWSSARSVEVAHAAVANHDNPDRPELEDYGEASLVADNGATNFVRVDWFTPDGLGTWGDGRNFILGTRGYIELRKYIDVARERTGNHVYLVDERGEHHVAVDGQVGYRFFGELILDCLNRTEYAMTQAHAFHAAELCLQAQAIARRLDARR
jgi:predicted dehydrogenase